MRALGCPHLEQIEKRLGPAGLKDLLDKHHLKLCAITCYFAGYRKYAELLGKMGGGVAVRESRFGKVTNLAAEMKAFFEQLKPDLELAEKYDSYLAIENHSGDVLLNSRDSFKAFFDMCPSSRIGIALALTTCRRSTSPSPKSSPWWESSCTSSMPGKTARA